MRQFFFLLAAVGILAALYYLYQRQLGAISFFVLSIFFFSLAISLYSKQTDLHQKTDKIAEKRLQKEKNH